MTIHTSLPQFLQFKKHDNLCGIAKVLGNLSNDMFLHCFATADKGIL